MDWLQKIQRGDVLRWPSGRLRVVRNVNHYRTPRSTVCNVTFAIQHCSWTHRPTTTYTSNDLRQMGVRPTKARISLRKKIDRAIQREISGSPSGPRKGMPRIHGERELFCCDVIGVAI